MFRMKKLLPYFIVLIVLGGALGYFLYTYAPSTLEKKESDFAVRDLKDVTRVLLTDEKGNKLELKKNDKETWIVNDGYEAGDEPLHLLFTALQKMTVRGPVPLNGIDNVLRELVKKHSRVEVFTSGDKPERVFYVGGPTLDDKGTYMIMEVDGKMAKRPYITYIQGLNAYLTSRFNTDSMYWRTRWVYRNTSANIKSVAVEYKYDSTQSFYINKNVEGQFVVENYKHQIENQPKQTYIEQYLDFFGQVSVEAFKNNYAGKDSVLQTEPFCVITLVDNEGATHRSVLYHAPITDASRVLADEQGRPLKFDIEHFYAQYNNGRDFAIVQYYVWNKVLRQYQDFFRKPIKRP